ncbi:MAG: hypothetical protein CVU38_02990 [Chloroflexi bacterium HGW-Chloroflexi-1]|nr:MAG: hypothetical protein CVU38_02990 [Chloroflexi bacterium HGW-Chloroflexi-1]
MLLPLGMLILVSLACGGFQVRVTPTVGPTPAAPAPTAAPTAPATPAPTAVPQAAVPTETALPTPTFLPAPGLAVGQMARVAASGGLNVRDQAATTGQKVGKLDVDAVVKLVSGPTQGESYTWWQIDDGAGLVGWVAAGTAEDKWLAPDVGAGPAAGGGKLSNRAVRLGDRVQVTTEEGKVLTVREAAGIDAPAVARVLPGTQFIVRGGPVRQDSFLWWQLEGEEVKGWAAEGQEGDRWLTPVEP